MVSFGRDEVKAFLENSLTERETQILEVAGSLVGHTYSTAVRMLSHQLPESTVKYVLKNLKRKGLIKFENNSPIKLTRLGYFLLGDCFWPRVRETCLRKREKETLHRDLPARG